MNSIYQLITLINYPITKIAERVGISRELLYYRCFIKNPSEKDLNALIEALEELIANDEATLKELKRYAKKAI